MKLLSKITIAALACAGFAHLAVASQKAASDTITIKNNSPHTLYMKVGFLKSSSGSLSESKKTTLKSGRSTKTRSGGKNSVTIDFYEDTTYKNKTFTHTLNLNASEFAGNRKINISKADDETPIVELNRIANRAKPVI